jgi:hypothetical protein
MRSVHRTLRAPSFLANIRPNLALLFRTGFRSIRRSENHMNIKVDLDALNRGWRHFYVRRTCHIYQGLWWEEVCTESYAAPSVLQKARRNIAVQFRTRFTATWRSKTHISLKVYAGVVFFSGVHHICQGQWRQYARKCACVYDIRNVKNKIQNSSNCYRQYLLCTNLT